MATDYALLNEHVEARRLDLRLTLGEVAERAGIHRNTLRAILQGRREPDRLTLRKLDEALEWRPGTSERVIDGGPVEAPDPAWVRFRMGLLEKMRAERLASPEWESATPAQRAAVMAAYDAKEAALRAEEARAAADLDDEVNRILHRD